jgi:hypothetical protein
LPFSAFFRLVLSASFCQFFLLSTFLLSSTFYRLLLSGTSCLNAAFCRLLLSAFFRLGVCVAFFWNPQYYSVLQCACRQVSLKVTKIKRGLLFYI